MNFRLFLENDLSQRSGAVKIGNLQEVPYVINPSLDTLKRMLGVYRDMRGLVTHDSLVAWDAKMAIHEDMEQALNIMGSKIRINLASHKGENGRIIFLFNGREDVNAANPWLRSYNVNFEHPFIDL